MRPASGVVEGGEEKNLPLPDWILRWILRLSNITKNASITVLHILKKVQAMQTAISKLTKKYQATVPKPVRKKLNLNAGDVIVFEIEDDAIKLRKARPVDIEFCSALVPTLSEWESQNDEEAYNDL